MADPGFSAYTGAGAGERQYQEAVRRAQREGESLSREEWSEIVEGGGGGIDSFGGFSVKKYLGDARVRLERKRAEEKKTSAIAGQQSRLDELKERSQARLTESQRLTDELLGRLPEATERATGAVDQRLGQLLTELGFSADEARKGAGAAAAGRGLGRSSMASEQVEDITLAEAEKKAKAQEAAELTKQQIRTTEASIKEGIESQKRLIDQKADIAEMNAIQAQLTQFQNQELKDVYQGELDRLKLGLELNTQVNTMLGGAFGDIGEIFAGFVIPSAKEE